MKKPSRVLVIIGLIILLSLLGMVHWHYLQQTEIRQYWLSGWWQSVFWTGGFGFIALALALTIVLISAKKKGTKPTTHQADNLFDLFILLSGSSVLVLGIMPLIDNAGLPLFYWHIEGLLAGWISLTLLALLIRAFFIYRRPPPRRRKKYAHRSV